MNLQQLKVTTAIVGSMVNALDLATPQVDLVKRYEREYDDGTAADQAQIIFSDTRSINATSSSNIDLAGSLPHPLGGTISFTALKEIIIVASDSNVGDLLFGEGVSNAFQGPFGASAVGVKVPPGGILHLANPSAAGWAVTAGTGDILAAENEGGQSNSFDIILVGEGTVA